MPNSTVETPFEIFLGPVVDPDGDSLRLDFDLQGNNFINIDTSDLSNVILSVNRIAPVGVYIILASLSDDYE